MTAAVHGGDWLAGAACLSADPDLFFPVSAPSPSVGQTAQAKAICARCRVRPECLRFALATREAHGVWGGTSEEERLRLRSDPAGARPTTAVPPAGICRLPAIGRTAAWAASTLTQVSAIRGREAEIAVLA